MVPQTLIIIFLTCSSLLIQHSISQTVNANCTPSSCGVIPSISYPFRLKNDPTNCGDPRAELACENDVAVFYINSHRYYVREINYDDLTIRLSHMHMHIPTDNISSICKYFTSSAADIDLFQDGNIYLLGTYITRVTLLSCAFPLQNSSVLTEVRDCEVKGTHTYLRVGAFEATEVEYMCTVGSMLATSWDFKALNDSVPLSEINESLFYGFNLSWDPNDLKCGGDIWRPGSDDSYWEWGGILTCDKDLPSYLHRKWAHIMESFRPPEGPSSGCLMVFMLVSAIVFIGGVSIAAKIVMGFGVSYLILVKWDRSNIQVVLVIGFGIRLSIGFLCGMGILIYKFRRRRMSEYEEIEGFLQSDNKLTPIRYSYSDLKKMTRGFREKLGEGGFGSVYKGKLRSGHHVAVKLLGKGTTMGQDFINEIGSIGRIHHVNVVELVGYCAERSKRALIFDFMSNGSLEKYIFNRGKTYFLDWDTKFKIAIGIARGIEYLHHGCDIQILHFDIKPHNILLDDKFVPKISDFGLAKLCSLEKDTVTMTAARGTIGYVAPELINRSIGAVSYKADVYSFGMMLIEMVGLNRESGRSIDDSTKYFPHWIYESLNQGQGVEVEMAKENNGNDDNENESAKSLIKKMTIVALWCIQMNPNDRPSMNKVLQMLEDDLERLHIPTEYPCESAHMEVVGEENWTSTGSIDSASLLHFNNASGINITIA